MQVESSSSSGVSARRRLQNREAQRRFRERKAKEQEDTWITSLHFDSGRASTTWQGGPTSVTGNQFDENFDPYTFQEGYVAHSNPINSPRPEQNTFDAASLGFPANMQFQQSGYETPPFRLDEGTVGLTEYHVPLPDASDSMSDRQCYSNIPTRPATGQRRTSRKLDDFECSRVDSVTSMAQRYNKDCTRISPGSSRRHSTATTPSSTTRSDEEDSAPRMPPLLHAATRSRNRGIATTLLKRGAVGVNERDDSGRTALHVASELGDAAVTSLLLRHGADPDARDKHGQTPLYVAVSEGHDQIVEMLLDPIERA